MSTQKRMGVDYFSQSQRKPWEHEQPTPSMRHWPSCQPITEQEILYCYMTPEQKANYREKIPKVIIRAKREVQPFVMIEVPWKSRLHFLPQCIEYNFSYNQSPPITHY